MKLYVRLLAWYPEHPPIRWFHPPAYTHSRCARARARSMATLRPRPYCNLCRARSGMRRRCGHRLGRRLARAGEDLPAYCGCRVLWRRWWRCGGPVSFRCPEGPFGDCIRTIRLDNLEGYPGRTHSRRLYPYIRCRVGRHYRAAPSPKAASWRAWSFHIAQVVVLDEASVGGLREAGACAAAMPMGRSVWGVSHRLFGHCCKSPGPHLCC